MKVEDQEIVSEEETTSAEEVVSEEETTGEEVVAERRFRRSNCRGRSIDVEEDINALISGEELSEEFQEKARTIFEAAIKLKLQKSKKR